MKIIKFIFFLLLINISFIYVVHGGGFYGSSNSAVISLSAENFAKEVFSSPHIWLIEFYAPWCGHCKKLTPEWERAAAKLKGVSIKIGAVDCTEESNKQLAAYYGIQGFPTIKFFGSKVEPLKEGKGVHKPAIDYQQARTSQAIIQYALSRLPSDHVHQINQKNQNDFNLVQNENDDSSTKKIAKNVILFTDKKKTTPLYKGLSIDFFSRVTFYEAKKDSIDSNFLEQFGVEKFPTLLIQFEDDTFKHYTDKLKHNDIFKWVNSFAVKKSKNQQPPPPQQQKKNNEQKEEEKKTPVMPNEIIHLEDNENFQDKCVSKGSLCLIGIFDKSSSDFQNYFDEFKNFAEKNLNRFKIFWFDGSKFDKTSEFFGVYNFPGFVAYSPNKQVYLQHRGSFSEKKLDSFLSSVLRGKKRAVSIDEKPILQSSNLKEEL